MAMAMDAPFIVKVLENGSLNVEEQKFQEILKNFPEKFLILSIVGDRKSGKSFFVNKIIKFLNPTLENYGFPTNVNIWETSENGIRIWPNAFKLKLPGHQDSYVLILDIDSKWEEGNLKFSENYSILEIFCLAISSVTIYLDKNEPGSPEIDTFINSANFHLPTINKSLQFPRKIIYLQNKWPIPDNIKSIRPKLKKVITHLDKLVGVQNPIYKLDNFFLDQRNQHDEDKFLDQNKLVKIISVILDETQNCQLFEKQNFFEIINWVVQTLNSQVKRQRKKDSKSGQKDIPLEKDQNLAQNATKNDESANLKVEIKHIIAQNCLKYARIFVEPKYREKFLEILCRKIEQELTKRPSFKSYSQDQIFSWVMGISDNVLKNWQEILDALDKMSIMIENEFDNNGAFSNEDLPELLFRAKKFAISRYTAKGVNLKKDEVFELFLTELRSNFQKRNQEIIEKEDLIAQEILKILLNFYTQEMSTIELSEFGAKHEEISKILLQVFISTCPVKSLEKFWQKSGIDLVNQINQLKVDLEKNLKSHKTIIPVMKTKLLEGRSDTKITQNIQNFPQEENSESNKVVNPVVKTILCKLEESGVKPTQNLSNFPQEENFKSSQIVVESRANLTSKSTNEEKFQEIMKNTTDIYEKKVSEYLKKEENIKKSSFETFLVNMKVDAFSYLNSNLPPSLNPDLKHQIQSEFEYKIDLLRLKFINEVQMNKLQVQTENKPENEDQDSLLKTREILEKAITLYDEKISEFFKNGGNQSYESFTTSEGISKFKAVQYFNSNLPVNLSPNSVSLYREELYNELEMKKSKNLAHFKQSVVENRPKVPEKPEKMKNIAIGIHFGTEHIRCGIFSNSKFEIVKNKEGDLALRNFLTILEIDGKRRYLVGDMARNTYLKNREKFTVQDYGNGSLVALEKKFQKFPQLEFIIGILLWEISTMVKNFTGCDIWTCVIALPISSTFLFRNVVKNAGEIVGFKKVHIVTEPMAAAYSVINKIGTDQTWPFLVLSHGKNQFDSTVLDVNLNGGKNHATSGKYLLSNYKGHEMLMVGDPNVNYEDNNQIITHSLNSLQNGGKFYGILVGDYLPNDLTSFKKNIRKIFPSVNLVEEIDFLEGIVQGASILVDKISNGILKMENFFDVNPFDLWIFNPYGEIFFYLKRNSELPLDRVVKLNNNFGGKFKFRDSKGSLRDFSIDSNVGDLWIKMDTSGLSLTKLVEGTISGCVEEINFLEEKTIQDFKLKFNNYLFSE